MRAGRLRHLINIERRAAGYDDRGHPNKAFAVIARKIRAEVLALNGRELERARQTVAEVTHQITIRLPQDINVKDKIVFGEKVFNVRSVIPDIRDDEAIVYCVEEVPK